MTGLLLLRGLRIQQTRIREMMRRVDSQGTYLRYFRCVITFVCANARTTLRKIVSNFTLKSNIRVKS